MVTAALLYSILHSPWLAPAGIAIFLLPGGVLLAAARARLRLEERIAWWFAASLVLLTATFAACVFGGFPIDAAPWTLAVVTLAASALARRFLPPGPAPDPTDHLKPGPSHFVLVVAGIACIAAAIAFAPVGSVDRWWYLAYVRGYLDGAPLDLAEPFLGTGQSFARFGFHPWLLGLAMWSQLAHLDAVEVYETAAPLLVVVACVSAAASLAIEMFGRTARTRLAILATMLLWCGGLVPVLARAGEDKILATAALLPLCLAAFLRALRDALAGSSGAALFLLFVAAAATAAVHALVHAFVLIAILPAAALFAITLPRRRATLSLAVTILLAVAVPPAVSGIVVNQRLNEIGADVSSPDHPVVRVHEARDRILELPAGVVVTNPRLLVHPLSLLALFALLTLAARSREALTRYVARATTGRELDAPTGGSGEDALVMRFLLVTTFVPLAIAFFPPLTALLGSLIPPWMVYRVLWILPLAPLAAMAADSFSTRFAQREAVAIVLLLVLGVPGAIATASARLAEVRERVAAPNGSDFAGMIATVASLPSDSLVVAAPELSERLPAFTGRHVVAGLDRSTIVFSGSRERGEARLRARAALLAGESDGPELARAAGVAPTHVVYDAGEWAEPRCASPLYRGATFAVCPLEPTRGEEARKLDRSTSTAANVVVDLLCHDDPPSEGKRNPWSARTPHVPCTARHGSGLVREAREGRILEIDVATGRATDEVRVSFVDAAGRRFRATVRTDGHETIRLALPPLDIGRTAFVIAPSFLPAVHVRSARIVEP